MLIFICTVKSRTNRDHWFTVDTYLETSDLFYSDVTCFPPLW